jgi:hypothetical protein
MTGPDPGPFVQKRGNYGETISLAQVAIVGFFPIYRRAAIFVSFINAQWPSVKSGNRLKISCSITHYKFVLLNSVRC